MNKHLTSQQVRAGRIRAKLLSVTTRPRLTVNRSNTHIFAQIIDQSGKVLVAFGSESLRISPSLVGESKATKQSKKMTKTEMATEVGKKLGEMAKEKKVTTVVFDRGSYRFHGRVKALAEAVRASGLKF